MFPGFLSLEATDKGTAVFDETPEPKAIRTDSEPCIRALLGELANTPAGVEITPKAEVPVPQDGKMLAGATFRILQAEGWDEYQIWLSSATNVAPDVMADVTRLRHEIIRLLLGGGPQSRRP